MKKVVLTIILALVALTGCGKNMTSTDTLVHSDNKYIVYVHQDGCHNCEQVDPLVKDFAKNNKNYKVYDINTSKIDFANSPFSDSTYQHNQYPMPVTDNIFIGGVPVIFVVENGETQSESIGLNDCKDKLSTLTNN